MFSDTESLFEEITPTESEIEISGEVKPTIEYIAEIPEAWQVRRSTKGAAKGFETLDTYMFKASEGKRYDEVAKRRGQLLGNNTVVEMFKKVYVCPDSGQLKTHKAERIIGVNGAKVEQKCGIYKKFNGRRN